MSTEERDKALAVLRLPPEEVYVFNLGWDARGQVTPDLDDIHNAIDEWAGSDADDGTWRSLGVAILALFNEKGNE